MKTVFFEIQPWEQDILQKKFPQASFTPDTLTEEQVRQYQDVEIVSSFIYSSFTKDIFHKLPALKLVATRSTGYDHIDVNAAHERTITVCNVPEYGSRTVAEYTFALLLAVSRKMYESISQSKNCEFNHAVIQGIDLYGKTIGVIGLGKIGIEVVKIAKGFGMQVVVYARKHNSALAQEYGFTYAELPQLLAQSDVITLHLPDVPDTHHIINKENILQCKRGSILINTARGGLIQTEAILLGLEKNILSGVGLDVLEGEKNLNEEAEIIAIHSTVSMDFKTMCINHVLMHHPKVVVTPHNAFNSKEALVRIVETTVENIQAFEEGRVINVV